MSDYLRSMAVRANLPHAQKAVLVAMCDACGEDDGTKCYPSLSYIGFKSDYSVRHVRRILRQLEAAGYLEPVFNLAGGRRDKDHGATTWYRIHIEGVPLLPLWRDVKAWLIESGELDPDEDLRDVRRAMRKIQRRHASQEPEREPAQAEGSAE